MDLHLKVPVCLRPVGRYAVWRPEKGIIKMFRFILCRFA